MIIDVQIDPETGDPFIEIPEEFTEILQLKFGDTILWTDNEDGSFTISKKVNKDES